MLVSHIAPAADLFFATRKDVDPDRLLRSLVYIAFSTQQISFLCVIVAGICCCVAVSISVVFMYCQPFVGVCFLLSVVALSTNSSIRCL